MQLFTFQSSSFPHRLVMTNDGNVHVLTEDGRTFDVVGNETVALDTSTAVQLPDVVFQQITNASLYDRPRLLRAIGHGS